MPESTKIALEEVLRAYGWTDSELDLLWIPSVAKALRKNLHTQQARSARKANTKALKAYGSHRVEHIFTEERTLELGFSKGMRTRFLAMTRTHKEHIPGTRFPPKYRDMPIQVIAQLHNIGRKSLLALSGCSKGTVKYVEAVFATIGLQLLED